MDIVIIGSSRREKLGLGDSYDALVDEYGTLLAEFADRIHIVPDNGIYTDVADSYMHYANKKALAYYPDKDVLYGYEHLKKNFHKYEAVPSGCDWYAQSAMLTCKAPVVIMLGCSPGTMIEASAIKFHQQFGVFKNPQFAKIHLLLDSRCLPDPLPVAWKEEINNLIEFDSFEELREILIRCQDLW